MDKRSFYKTRGDRKYTSIVDEYRRYYVTGKNFKIKGAKNIGDKIFELCVNEILRPIKKNKIGRKEELEYSTLIPGQKIGNSKYRKNMMIAEFKKGRIFVFQFQDDKGNIYRISVEVKSNKSNKVYYSEWVKKEKSFFGLRDTAGKVFMRRAVVRKSKLLKRKIEGILFNSKGKKYWFEKDSRDYDKSKKVQSSKRGFISRRELSYDDDLGGRYDKNIVAPDRTSREIEGTEDTLKKAEKEAEKAKGDKK